MHLSELSLYAATKEQTIVAWKRGASEWGTGLTLEEYVDREFVGHKVEFARDGKQKTWVLAPRNDPTTLDFLCSCKTFKRKIVVSRSPQDGIAGPVLEHGIGYAVASVVTPLQYRGKGYGKHMMRLLHWVLAREEYLDTQTFPKDQWGPRPPRVPTHAGDASVAVLWSDVGPTFYQVCGMGEGVERRDGWVVRNPFSTIWNVHKVDLSEVEEGKVTWLDEESAKAIWKEDAAQIEAEVVEAAKSQGQTRTYLSFLPNEGVAEYQWFRLHYHFSRHVSDPPRWCGLKMDKGGAFVTWTYDLRIESSKTMILTRLRANEEEIEVLMARVLRYARDHGLDTVEIWNLAPNLENALSRFGGYVVERDEHLPAIKWYGDESVVWLYNEKFCWC